MADDRDSRPRALSVQRRRFLQTGALAGAALVAPTGAARAQSATTEAAQRGTATPVMTAAAEAAPPGRRPGPRATTSAAAPISWSTCSSRSTSTTSARIPGRASADCTNRSSTTAATQSPELLTCMHEESSVAMAHGYFKASRASRSP